MKDTPPPVAALPDGNAAAGPAVDELFFREHGYAVVRGLLTPEADLEPLAKAYSGLVDELAAHVCGTAPGKLIPEYPALDFPSRLAILAGMTRGSVFDHLAPTLNIYERGYRRWRNAPCAQPVELFALIRHRKILDAVEMLIGEEIWATPAYHFNIKLAARHREWMRRASARARQAGVFRKPVLPPVPFITEFQVGQTPWHMDSYPGLGDENAHDYVVVWVPMTPAGPSNGTLRILPCSHNNGYCAFPSEREHEGISVEAEPGDVVFMDGMTFHSSLKNPSDIHHRWSFNMRYMPPGKPYGKRFLPGFVARSRAHPETELHDAELWCKAWDAALDYLDRYVLPLRHQFFLTAGETVELDAHWQRLVPDFESWLNLHEHGNPAQAAICSARKAADRVRGRLIRFKDRFMNK